MDRSDIQNLLVDLGYTLTNDSKGFRCPAIHRDGSNPTSLLVYFDGSGYSDFVTGETGSLKQLIKKSINLVTDEAVDSFIKDRHFDLTTLPKTKTPKIKSPTTYPIDILKNLLEIHTYWQDRGISLETIKQFRGGIALKGRLKDRYVFPIFNKTGQIIGFQGRTTINNSIKWKIIGSSRDFAFPLYLNVKKIREQSEIILVEGIGDVLTLFEVGIKNCAALFGTELKLGLLNALLRINPKKIIIATNYDQNNVGQEAAIKIETKLRKFFDFKSIEIRYPIGAKDFNDMLKLEDGKNKILNWYNS